MDSTYSEWRKDEIYHKGAALVHAGENRLEQIRNTPKVEVLDHTDHTITTMRRDVAEVYTRRGRVSERKLYSHPASAEYCNNYELIDWGK